VSVCEIDFGQTDIVLAQINMTKQTLKLYDFGSSKLR
jgi:hypothetical protein